MKRIWLVLSVLGTMSCILFHNSAPLVPPLRGFSYTPPPVYWQWFSEAHSCSQMLQRVLGDTAGFWVDSAAVEILARTWIAVPTERFDHGFIVTNGRQQLVVWGLTASSGDTVWLPAPLIEAKSLVKHEAMHIFVHSHGEMIVGDHGLPWGFCEYL